MKNLTNTFDNLSTEILLDIFEYLSVHDCFNAFYNINSTLNSTFNLLGLSVDLTSISRRTYNEFYKKQIFSKYYCQIRKLKMSNELTIKLIENFFKNYDLTDFKQLRSLNLIRPSYMTLGSFALMLPYLNQFEHLSVDTNSYPNNFFELIATSSPTLKACYLPGLEIQDPFDFQSKIEYLTITVEDITLLFNLLALFPELKYLHVLLRSSLDFDKDSLPTINQVLCKNLRILKLEVLERSSIEFDEIEYFFQNTSFKCLKSLSYNCTTKSLDHIDAARWNKIFSKHLSHLENFHLFVQIPYNSYSYMNIKEVFNILQENISYSCSFSLSINYLYYIIHTNIYPKACFDLSFKLSDTNEYYNYDPINCDRTLKFSKVNSLTIDINSMSTFTILPGNLKHLSIQGQTGDYINLHKCLNECSQQLVSLKICSLPIDLPEMPELRHLMIQKAMFNLNMAARLSDLCPRLESLTVEIDCIEKFGQILDQLRFKSNLTELKFIRAFSRDISNSWTPWLNEANQSFINSNINYETKNLFLFLWL